MNVPFKAREDAHVGRRALEAQTGYSGEEAQGKRRRTGRGRAAVEQARLILLAMLNVAQLWILAATVESGLAHSYRKLLPLVIASGVCWIVALSIILWWRPASRRFTSSGYVRESSR